MRPNPYALPPPAFDRVAGTCGPRDRMPPWGGMPGTMPYDCDGIVGFLDAAVATATQTTITINPQDCGVVERLVATDAAENTFQLDDFLVGRMSAFGAVPVSFASLKSDATARCMRTVGGFSPGTNLTLQATNFTGGAARLSANAHYRKGPNGNGADSSMVK